MSRFEPSNSKQLINLSRGVSEYEWIATSGQVVYTLPPDQNYDVTSKWLEVFVGGAPIPDSQIQKNSSTQFTLLINSSIIQDGMLVFARWTQPYIPATSGHHTTHQLGGTDEIDVTKLLNYEEQIATPMAQIATNVKSFGAKGDGVTDDTTAIQNAINSLSNGGVLYIPAGTYVISNTLTITNNYTVIKGNGLTTVLSFKGSGKAISLGHSDYSTTIENIKLKDFHLDGGNSPTGTDTFGVVAYRALYCEFDLNISNFNKTTNSKGIVLDGGYSANINNFCATNIIYPRIGQCSQGIFLDNCVQNTLFIGGVVAGDLSNKTNYPYGININDVQSAGNLIIGTDVEDCNVGVRVNGVQNQLIRPRIENCNTFFLHDTQASQTHIVSSWGLDDSSAITNNGGQLKVDVMGYDLLSQLVKVVSPASGTSAELDIMGGTSSNAMLKLFKGANQVFEVSNIPSGNDIRMFALQADNSMHEMMGLRTDGYIAKTYLKGCLTFDNALNSGDVPNSSLFVHDADGKLSFKDSAGTVTALY